MYESFFKLSGQPFKLSPDPKFFYGSRSHNKAMAYLHYGLRQAEGFIVITGEIGAGKSMLIGHLLDQLDRSNVVAAHLLTPNLKAEDLLSHILSSFNIEPAGDGKAAEIEAFEDFLFDQMNRGRRVLLIVDEAQNLPFDTLEELRILSNLDYEGTPLFQVFLVGQPDFKPVIAAPELEQLRQRIIASYHLNPLNLEETREYIRHRLSVVAWDNDPAFTDEAFDLVFEATGGVPRKINKLCTRILLFSAIDKRHEVDGAVVRTVVADLASEDVSGKPMSLSPPTSAEDVSTTVVNGHDQGAEMADHDAPESSGDEESTDTMGEIIAGQNSDDQTAAEGEGVSNVVAVDFPAPTPIDEARATGDDQDEISPEEPVQDEGGDDMGFEDDMPAMLTDSPVTDDEPDASDNAVSVAALAAGASVFDQLRSQKKISKRKADPDKARLTVSDILNPPAQMGTSTPGPATASLQEAQASKNPEPATIDDVAEAIAQAGVAASSEFDDGGDDIDADDAAFPRSDRGDLESADINEGKFWEDVEKGPGAWRKAVTKSIEETRADLRHAHSSVAKLRRKLDDIERRREISQGEIVKHLTRAEDLLTEIRDVQR